MKVAYCSDLHLEFAPIGLKNTEGTDVLILAGDICMAEAMKRFPFYDNERGTDSAFERASREYQKFFEEVAAEFPKVLYVAGNHEFYRGAYDRSILELRKNLHAVSDNIHFLNADCLQLGDVWFVGGTLWTDFGNHNPVSMFDAQQMMSDYRAITWDKNGNFRTIRPLDTFGEHLRCRDFIKHVAKDKEKVVVISHHAPSYQSIADEYVGSALNDAYVSNLESLILDHPGITKWIHGHVHATTSYTVGQCEVLANPRGYPGEEVHENFKLLHFEV